MKEKRGCCFPFDFIREIELKWAVTLRNRSRKLERKGRLHSSPLATLPFKSVVHFVHFPDKCSISLHGQFSESLISHLSANSTATPSSTSPSSERQSTLDSHIQSRIAAELTRLQQEENHVRQQIEQALEKENLDKERGEEGAAHSVSLLKDLQQLESRLESNKLESKRIKDAAPWDIVAQNKSALTECLSSVPSLFVSASSC